MPLPSLMIDTPGPFASMKQLQEFLDSLDSMPDAPEVTEARDQARAQLKLLLQQDGHSSSSLKNPAA